MSNLLTARYNEEGTQVSNLPNSGDVESLRALSAELAAMGVGRLMKRSNSSWLAKVPSLTNAGLNTGSLGYTHQAMMEVECHFDTIRIPLFNFDTAGTQTVDLVKVSVGGNAADALNNSATFVSVTFSGSEAGTVPAATTVNGRIYPGVLLSDIIYIRSTARTDGGTLPLLYVRCYMSSGAGKNWSTWTNGSAAAAWGSANSTRKFVTRYKSGDFVTSNYTGFTDDTNRSFSVIFGVMYRARNAGVRSLLCHGDSITSATNISYFKGWHFKTQAALSSLTSPLEYVNAGVSSSHFDEFLAYATVLIPVFTPSHVVIPAFTPNGGPAEIDLIRENFVKLIDLCRANNAIPLVWSGCPRSTGANETSYYTAEEDLIRTIWLEEAEGYVVDFVDTAMTLSTTAAPHAYKLGMTTDGLHPDDDGDTVIAEQMISSSSLAITA